MRKALLASLLSLTVVATMLFSRSARAQSPVACELLASLKIENVNLLSAAKVEATADLPSHCRVLGYVQPAIDFEIRLPVQNWNGKFYMTGCGGFCRSTAIGPDSPIR